MMNISIRVIENLHEGTDILDSEKSARKPAKALMENGILGDSRAVGKFPEVRDWA
jgi:hypothetical protein